MLEVGLEGRFLRLGGYGGSIVFEVEKKRARVFYILRFQSATQRTRMRRKIHTALTRVRS